MIGPALADTDCKGMPCLPSTALRPCQAKLSSEPEGEAPEGCAAEGMPVESKSAASKMPSSSTMQ